MKVTASPDIEASASSVSRVVPGCAVTMALSSPSSALSREDFPVFGRPIMAQRTPSRSALPALAVRSSAVSSALIASSLAMHDVAVCCSRSSSG